MLTTLSHLLAIICLVATLLPLSRREVWWVRAADFPRLQIAVLASIALALILLASPGLTLAEGSIAVALGIAILYHASAILPYMSVWPKEMAAASAAEHGSALSVMVANVLMSNRETERLFSMIDRHRPDILLAVETDEWWCRQLEAKTEDWRYKVSHPLDNTYGMFLCSRLELIGSEIRFLLKDDIPSIRAEALLEGGGRVELHALHPEPPSPTEAETALHRDAELITVAREIAERGQNAIVMGDLNDVAWSRTSRLFRRLAGVLDPRIGRGLFSTFHAGYPLLRWPLDHVFASDDFLLEDIQRLDGFGSDHFPILVKLRLSPEAAHRQAAETTDDVDEREAEDKLERSRAELEDETVGAEPR